jgi:choline dehydrogenase-like flavoprotein
LLEGGGPNDNLALRSPELRASLAFIEPAVNWGYISVPQHQLSGQEIPCARGKGLGGSSAISFSCWLLGDKEDFNEWADVTGDVCWKWEGEGGVMERLRKIEHVHFTPNPRQAEYVSQEALDQHSKTGAVDVSYDQHWHELEFLTFEAGKELGVSGPLPQTFPQLSVTNILSQTISFQLRLI